MPIVCYISDQTFLYNLIFEYNIFGWINRFYVEVIQFPVHLKDNHQYYLIVVLPLLLLLFCFYSIINK